MPAFICSSRYTIDSQILRKEAQQLGWETLRLDGGTIPDWFEPPDDGIAFFFTAPHVFDVAAQLGRTMLGCNPDWTANLPADLLKRELYQTSLTDAVRLNGRQFVKHSVSKAFPAGLYDARTLSKACADLPPDSLVHVGEPVVWTHEYRCFVANGEISTISPYVCDGVVVADYESFPTLSDAEQSAVLAFAKSVLDRPEVTYPKAFVLDVGRIADRGWAVVECNECWASGIYACDPKRVLKTLLAGNEVASDISSSSWDFARHYAAACS